MKKTLGLIITGAALLLLAACAQTAGEESPSPTAQAVETEQVTASPEPTIQTPEPEDTPEPAESPDLPDWEGLYSDFLASNYDALTEACPIGFAGLGFVDLDLDLVPELALFDSGASASMGLQFFDIIDGEVKCVSANILEIGGLFGAPDMTDAYVNANAMSDFRLLEKGETGEWGFFVTSANGAIDFSYEELIRFSGVDGALALNRVLYTYMEYDMETGDVILSRFAAEARETIDEAEYNALKADFDSAWTDTGYAAKGAFIWEKPEYENGFAGFAAMVDAALKSYVSVSEDAAKG